VVDSLPQRWKEWSAISNLRKQKLICYNERFGELIKENLNAFALLSGYRIYTGKEESN